MIDVSLNLNLADLKKDLQILEGNLDSACERICNRLGLAAEALAVENVAVNTGRARDEIRWTGAKRTRDGFSGDVVALAAHSLYIELGFTGHFVPFKVSDDLYRQALTRWGWRVPDPNQLTNARPGERYLIPKGRKSPTAGVFVSGKAQPFLRPAIQEVNLTLRDKVVAEEINLAVKQSRT